jgi:superfamily II DNA/RNA helicase
VRDGEFANARNNNSNKKTFQEDVVLERLTGLADEDAMITGTFEEMNLHEKLLAGLIGMGAVTPFPIQAATIPAALEGRDILGRGKTGSGKTVAFSVPVVTKLVNGGSQQRKPGQARALILAPTRELADQIERTVKALARPVGFFTVAIYGGVPQRRQEIAMSRGTDIIVATPGRLEDLMAQGIIDLSAVEAVVVDEADHMCDLGFIEPVRRILRAVGDSQKLLFSATLDREVDSLVREFLPDPYIYEVNEEEEDHSNITHRVLIVDPEDRSDVLLRLTQGFEKTLIFTRTKMTAERLSESLTGAGVPAARLHGDLNQNQRNRNLERFVKGHVRVLVATDVAARGIHVDDVALVIQVDPPEEYKTYLHRSGRTGRAGKQGTVVTLIPRSRRRRLEDLLRRADRDGIYTDVRPSNPLLEELAGPIAPPPAPEVLDFGDSRGSSSRGGSRDGGSRDGGRGGYRGGDRDNRGGGARRGNSNGNGKGRWADRPAGAGRPRDRRPSDA